MKYKEDSVNQSNSFHVHVADAKARQNLCERGAIGFALSSHSMTKWRGIFKPIKKSTDVHTKPKPKQIG